MDFVNTQIKSENTVCLAGSKQGASVYIRKCGSACFGYLQRFPGCVTQQPGICIIYRVRKRGRACS